MTWRRPAGARQPAKRKKDGAAAVTREDAVAAATASSQNSALSHRHTLGAFDSYAQS